MSSEVVGFSYCENSLLLRSLCSGVSNVFSESKMNVSTCPTLSKILAQAKRKQQASSTFYKIHNNLVTTDKNRYLSDRCLRLVEGTEVLDPTPFSITVRMQTQMD